MYTPSKADAEKLAISIYGPESLYEGLTQPHHFQHFHSGGFHPELPPGQEGRSGAMNGPGHVFFGFRGENLIRRDQ